MNTCRRAAALFLVLTGFAAIATAESLPHTEAQTLTDKKVAIPADLQGHPTLFILGFSHKSKEPTSEWNKAVKQRLGSDHELVVYQAAVLEDLPRMIRGMVIGGIRKGTPEIERDHFLIVLHDEKQWKAAADFSNGDDAYLVLADAAGNIRWRTHAAVSDEAIAQLKTEAQKVETEPVTK